jgi:16S rRNA processing protein RimM
MPQFATYRRVRDLAQDTKTASGTPSRRICVGQFAGAHGVRGLVRLRSFTAEPENIFDYVPLTNESGDMVYKIAPKSEGNDFYVVAVEGIADKDQADELRGDKIYIERGALPKPAKGEYYQADLIGLSARDASGNEYGAVMDVHDHGAGVFLEIGKTRRDSFMLPFKDAFVPQVDLKAGAITVAVPEGWLTKEKPGESEQDE